MKEIRIHGRKGRGSIVAAHILEQAALLSGHFAQAVASTGEAQETAVVRIYEIGIQPCGDGPDPTFVIVQDHTLLHSVGVTDDLPENTHVLINWSEVAAPTVLKRGQIVVMPASCIAEEFTAQPTTNVALLSALIALTGMLPPKALEDSIALHFRGEELQRNLTLLRTVARLVPSGLWKESANVAGLELTPQSFLH